MKRLIILFLLSFIVITFITACGGVSQEDYDDVLSQLNAISNKYAQVEADNNNLNNALIDSENDVEELQAQLTQSEQLVSSLTMEIDTYKAIPLKTDVEIYNSTIIRGRTVVGCFNYFDRIEGKLFGDGFHAYLKESGTGKIVLDLGTEHEREFSFTPPDPFVDYYIDYEILDPDVDYLPYTLAYVLFYK